MINSTSSVLIPSKKSVSSRQLADAYCDIKTILINAYPEALSMEDLVKATNNQWKQSEILLATDHGTQIHELLRDATYYPARYRINPDILQPTFNPRSPADHRTTQQDVTLEGHATGQSPVTVIHKKKKVLEIPRAAKDERPIRPAKKTRRTGVFKEIVACLIRADTHLTADEILYQSGMQSSKAVLMSILSDRLAKKQIARDAGTKPYRYYVPDHLKARYLARFGMADEQMTPPMQLFAPASPQAETGSMATAHPVETDARSLPSDANFDITLTLRGKLTLTIDDQTMALDPHWTRQLATMIRHLAD